MVFSTIKNKFWWGGGVVFRKQKVVFLAHLGYVFGVKKVKNSHSVAPILPFCRAEMVASYLFVVDKLTVFCRYSN